MASKIYQLYDGDKHMVNTYDEEGIIEAIRKDNVCGGDIIKVIMEE